MADAMSQPGAMFKLDVQAENGTVLVRCEGELCLSVSDKLRDAIAWSYSPDLKMLRVDMSALTFMDPSGVACLIEASHRCRDLGVSFEVVPSEMVARLLDLTDAPVPRAAPAQPALDRSAT